MPTLLFALLLSLQAGPDIHTEAVGPGAWRLTVTVEGETDPSAVAPRLQPRAAELCGPAGYHFGRYTFSANEAVDAGGAGEPPSLTLVQDIACGPRPPEPPPPPPAPMLTEAEAADLQPKVQTLSDRYFAAVDEGRHADSMAMADEAMTAGATLEEWSAREDDRRTAIGVAGKRRIGRFTWYSNPAGAPFGHYAAVDYVASHEHQDECGYLVWYRPAAGAEFRLVRQETTFLPRDLDADTTAALRRQHCIIL
ncbi:MAG TPA: DUF4019 domain-containing protein [Brevundimonas sp.]|nr:DUF4019 domain-containing protein [Brevundimonas sp.]